MDNIFQLRVPIRFEDILRLEYAGSLTNKVRLRGAEVRRRRLYCPRKLFLAFFLRILDWHAYGGTEGDVREMKWVRRV